MKYRKMAALMFGVALGLGSLAVNSQAQDRDDYGPQVSPRVVLTQFGWGNNNSSFDHGYRDGMNAGLNDGQKGKGFIMYDHGAYRDSHDQAYREGYQRGYREAYNSSSRGGTYNNGGYNGSNNGGYRNDGQRDRDRDDRWRRNHDRDERLRRDHDQNGDNHWRDRDHDRDQHKFDRG